MGGGKQLCKELYKVLGPPARRDGFQLKKRIFGSKGRHLVRECEHHTELLDLICDEKQWRLQAGVVFHKVDQEFARYYGFEESYLGSLADIAHKRWDDDFHHYPADEAQNARLRELYLQEVQPWWELASQPAWSLSQLLKKMRLPKLHPSILTNPDDFILPMLLGHSLQDTQAVAEAGHLLVKYLSEPDREEFKYRDWGYQAHALLSWVDSSGAEIEEIEALRGMVERVES